MGRASKLVIEKIEIDLFYAQQAIIKFLDIYTKCYRLLMQFQPDKIIFSLILSLIADLGNSKTVILLSCRDQNFVTICNYCF